MFYGPSIIFIELLLNSVGSDGNRIRISGGIESELAGLGFSSFFAIYNGFDDFSKFHSPVSTIHLEKSSN